MLMSNCVSVTSDACLPVIPIYWNSNIARTSFPNNLGAIVAETFATYSAKERKNLERQTCYEFLIIPREEDGFDKKTAYERLQTFGTEGKYFPKNV